MTRSILIAGFLALAITACGKTEEAAPIPEATPAPAMPAPADANANKPADPSATMPSNSDAAKPADVVAPATPADAAKSK